MQYFDKNGKEIIAGMRLIMPDGHLEPVYETVDQHGDPDLGISASDEEFLKKHPQQEREFYSLSQLHLADIEICPMKKELYTEFCAYAPKMLKKLPKIIPFLLWVCAPIILSIVLFCNFRIIITDGASMEPTYKAGDILLVRRTEQIPEVGDEVIVRLSDGTCVLKRVAYLPGDDVTQDGYEAYWAESDEQENKIPNDYVYVLGDNLEESIDSRNSHFGLVSVENIWGKPIFKFPYSLQTKEE